MRLRTLKRILRATRLADPVGAPCLEMKPAVRRKTQLVQLMQLVPREAGALCSNACQ